jgi:plasmid stabilization system protein ParE
MKYVVEILPQALDNVESAYRWMANNISSEQAEQWYEELMVAVQSLEKFPNRASPAPEAAEFAQDIRQLFVGKSRKYRLLFIVTNSHVSILDVRHASQLWLENE